MRQVFAKGMWQSVKQDFENKEALPFPCKCGDIQRCWIENMLIINSTQVFPVPQKNTSGRGVGVKLQVADTAIIFDTDLNPQLSGTPTDEQDPDVLRQRFAKFTKIKVKITLRDVQKSVYVIVPELEEIGVTRRDVHRGGSPKARVVAYKV
ncbi:hypothetical protein AgCh_002623 [Apium graveolens]